MNINLLCHCFAVQLFEGCMVVVDGRVMKVICNDQPKQALVSISE